MWDHNDDLLRNAALIYGQAYDVSFDDIRRDKRHWESVGYIYSCILNCIHYEVPTIRSTNQLDRDPTETRPESYPSGGVCFVSY